LVVVGHIHYSYSRGMINDTVFCNASILNEEYKMIQKPIILELVEGKIKITPQPNIIL